MISPGQDTFATSFAPVTLAFFLSVKHTNLLSNLGPLHEMVYLALSYYSGPNSDITTQSRLLDPGLPWWSSGQEFALQCRGQGFDPRSGKIPHAEEQLSP